MTANQMVFHAWIKRFVVIKFLLAEKCKPFEINRMFDVYGGETCLPLWVWVEKTIDGVEIHWLSSKEKVPDAAVSKEGHAVFWDIKGLIIIIDFLKNGVTTNSASYCQLLW